MRAALLAALVACAPEAPPAAPLAAADTGAAAPSPRAATPASSPLPAPRLLRRLSLDLRGVLPTAAELDRVEADPDAVWALRDAWLADPRLEERLVHLLAERWHTRVDSFLVQYLDYQALAYDPDNALRFERSVGEEPLRLLARIAVSDRPWTDAVMADHTMADARLASIWPLEREEGEGWQPARYTDGRPAAGVLATNGLWWRYYTTRSNANRARVAALSRLLVCEDYAARTITFAEDDALAGGGELEDALRESPYCQGCHAGLDPVAAALFGFWSANEYQTDEIDTYHPERELLGQDVLGVQAAWYGDPVTGLHELGAHIADDPRFPMCGAETFAALLWRRDPTPADRDELSALRAAFEAGGLRVLPLLAAITETEAYQAGAAHPDADAQAAGRDPTLRLLPPNALHSAVADLTGFRWTQAGLDAMDDDTTGYRNLAGGVDGRAITRPQEGPGLTRALVTQRLAESAAWHVVERDLQGGGTPTLLTGVTLDTPADDPAVAAQLDALCWRMLGERPSASTHDALLALWTATHGEEGPAAAWAAALTALLRHPLFVSA
jgi:hypothetical protein